MDSESGTNTWFGVLPFKLGEALLFRKALKGNISSGLQFSACFVERGASKKSFGMANFSKALIRFRGSQFLRASLRRGGLKLVAQLILSEADYRSEAINRRTVPLTWPLSH